MSILIKGMEIPKNCLCCAFDVYGLCIINANAEKSNEISHNCPLTEIPPHGVLIDMDDFLSEWSELESYRTAMSLCEIIPADGGKT